MLPNTPSSRGFSLVTAGRAPNPNIFQVQNETEELGMPERQLILSVTGPQKRLDYPTKKEINSLGKEIEVYIIPQEDKQAVLEKLYFFTPVPNMDTTLFDLHQQKTFTVRDFIVTRENEGNILVSPYYLETGGTMLDWIDIPPDQNPDDFVVECRLFNPNLTNMIEKLYLDCEDIHHEKRDEYDAKLDNHVECEEYDIDELDDFEDI